MELLWFVLALGLVAVLMALAMVLVALVAVRTVRKRNRVSPTTETNAPTTWMGAPSAGARLHRRLRTAVRVARGSADLAATSAPHLADLVAELEREAIAIDTHVVLASRLRGKEGRARMSALGQQVLKVEQVASQVSMLAAQAQAPMVARGQSSALDDLARQLDHLEEARHEIAAVETAAGVRRVSPYADPTRVVPAPRSSPVPRLRKQPPGQAVPGT